MGLQLIFVVETNKKCKSDWIYIKDTIDRFFEYEQAQIKFSPIYMDGATFKAKKLIEAVDESKLVVNNYRANTSNIMIVIDKYLSRK